MSTQPRKRAKYSVRDKRCLTVVFDVGTTFSAVSWCIQLPGRKPEYYSITRFPGQGVASGDSKVPSKIYYDKSGAARAVGVEVTQRAISELAVEEDWTLVELFKLHLRPYDVNDQVSQLLPRLPVNKSIQSIFADFLSYLNRCSKARITEARPDARSFWSNDCQNLKYVITIPNGWGMAQMSQLRHAAVEAGMIENIDDAENRVLFVTEGEASLHDCITQGLLEHAVKMGEGILIVDAGGGTNDFGAYTPSDTTSNDTTYEEIAAPRCHFRGSIYVNMAFKEFIQAKLKGSKFEHTLESFYEAFDKYTKPTFRSVKDHHFVPFGTLNDNDNTLGIKDGQMKIDGHDMAEFFQPSIESIISGCLSSITQALEDFNVTIKTAILVGGFADNDYLFDQVKELLSQCNVEVFRPPTLIKTVPQGALSYAVTQRVSSRVSQHHYGTPCEFIYNPADPAHLQRSNTTFEYASGARMVKGGFDTILTKSVLVKKTQEYRRSYYREFKTLPASSNEIVNESILCYTGNKKEPCWTDVEPETFSELCKIQLDMSLLKNCAKMRMGRGGVRYYRVEYDIVLFFGLIELKAQIAWSENGDEKRDKAKIVYSKNFQTVYADLDIPPH